MGLRDRDRRVPRRRAVDLGVRAAGPGCPAFGDPQKILTSWTGYAALIAMPSNERQRCPASPALVRHHEHASARRRLQQTCQDIAHSH
jgi:hypothetical protein